MVRTFIFMAALLSFGMVNVSSAQIVRKPTQAPPPPPGPPPDFIDDEADFDDGDDLPPEEFTAPPRPAFNNPPPPPPQNRQPLPLPQAPAPTPAPAAATPSFDNRTKLTGSKIRFKIVNGEYWEKGKKRQRGKMIEAQ